MNDPGLEDVISTADDAVQEEIPQGRQANTGRKSKRARPQYSQNREEIGLYQPTYVMIIVVKQF